MTPINLDRQRRYLIIGAHPDDCELGAGLTALILKDQGDSVCSLSLTLGEQRDTEKRVFEGMAAGKIIGYDVPPFFFNFPDTELYKYVREMQKALENFREFYQPDTVIYHSKDDRHQDHVAVHDAADRAFRDGPDKLLMWTPSTKSFDAHISMYTRDPILAYKKFVALNAYESQKDIVNPSSQFARMISWGSEVRTKQQPQEFEKIDEVVEELLELDPYGFRSDSSDEMCRAIYKAKLQHEIPASTVYAERFVPNCMNFGHKI